MKVLNKNKKIIKYIHKVLFKEAYFKRESIKQLATTLGYNLHAVEKYLNGSATTYHTENGVTKKRCSICKVRRNVDDFTTGTNRYKRAACKLCTNQITRNIYKIRKNIGLHKYSQLSRERHSWKYKIIRNIKGKVKRRLTSNKYKGNNTKPMKSF